MDHIDDSFLAGLFTQAATPAPVGDEAGASASASASDGASPAASSSSSAMNAGRRGSMLNTQEVEKGLMFTPLSDILGNLK